MAGWAAFERVASPAARSLIVELDREPGPLLGALEQLPRTGLHGDLKLANVAFLDGPDARSLRILAEYLQPLRELRRARVHDTVVFFGSARLREDGPFGRYYREARELARLVTAWSLSVPANGHRFITEVVEAFPGSIESVGLHKPTLEDVFLRETGAALW